MDNDIHCNSRLEWIVDTDLPDSRARPPEADQCTVYGMRLYQRLFESAAVYN